ncbi:unnamed protein product [marine sediment metagenome]|uniref:Uncharacterized protein n=1 Tax=marine sediment metagenome TaxID=412755 RepID=X1BTQ8_9ZZZZ
MGVTVHFSVILRERGDRRILETLRGACPERQEILHFVQNNRKRRAQGDTGWLNAYAWE